MNHVMMVQLLTHAVASTSPTLWYVTRAAAFSAYIMLTLTVILGSLRGIARGARERLSWTVDELHQFTALMFVALLLTHLITLMLDAYLPFSLLNLLLPFNEPYSPFAVNLGVFALYTTALVYGSSLLKHMLTHRVWRGLHYLSFVCFALVTLHGLWAGSDAKEPWMRAIYAGSAAGVAFLMFVRVFTSSNAPVPHKG